VLDTRIVRGFSESMGAVYDGRPFGGVIRIMPRKFTIKSDSTSPVEKQSIVREGMYAVVYHDESRKNSGYATVVLENGSIRGAERSVVCTTAATRTMRLRLTPMCFEG
jgi:hypothetical protein